MGSAIPSMTRRPDVRLENDAHGSKEQRTAELDLALIRHRPIIPYAANVIWGTVRIPL
jgi:hypothetical protein